MENTTKIYDYYEDADSWVIAPYPELALWAKEQYEGIKESGSIVIFTPFIDNRNGLKSDGAIGVNIEREEDIEIPNKDGEMVTVEGNVTVTITMKLVSIEGETSDVVLRFFGNGDFPLY